MEHHPTGIGATHGPPSPIDDSATFGQSLETPTLDYERYRKDLADFGLSEAEENAYLEMLWRLVQSVIDASFGLDSAQLLLGALTENTGLTEKDTLVLEDSITNPGGAHE